MVLLYITTCGILSQYRTLLTVTFQPWLLSRFFGSKILTKLRELISEGVSDKWKGEWLMFGVGELARETENSLFAYITNLRNVFSFQRPKSCDMPLRKWHLKY
jgi:hypothetical protein